MSLPPPDHHHIGPDDAQEPVKLGAVAPGEPYARAPVEIEAPNRNSQSGATSWSGTERRRSPAMPGLVQLGDMVPALRLLVGMMIASLVIAALYFGREMLIPLALASLLGFCWIRPSRASSAGACHGWLQPWWWWRWRWVCWEGLACIWAARCSSSARICQPTSPPSATSCVACAKANMPSAWDGVFKTYHTVEKEMVNTDGKPARVQKVQIETPSPSPRRRCCNG